MHELRQRFFVHVIKTVDIEGEKKKLILDKIKVILDKIKVILENIKVISDKIKVISDKIKVGYVALFCYIIAFDL